MQIWFDMKSFPSLKYHNAFWKESLQELDYILQIINYNELIGRLSWLHDCMFARLQDFFALGLNPMALIAKRPD
jgi:hypothetical protein